MTGPRDVPPAQRRADLRLVEHDIRNHQLNCTSCRPRQPCAGMRELQAMAKEILEETRGTAMSAWRVIYRGAAGEGRFEDVDARSKEHAAWQVSAGLDSKISELVEVRAIDGRCGEAMT